MTSYQLGENFSWNKPQKEITCQDAVTPVETVKGP